MGLHSRPHCSISEFDLVFFQYSSSNPSSTTRSALGVVAAFAFSSQRDLEVLSSGPDSAIYCRHGISPRATNSWHVPRCVASSLHCSSPLCLMTAIISTHQQVLPTFDDP